MIIKRLTANDQKNQEDDKMPVERDLLQELAENTYLLQASDSEVPEPNIGIIITGGGTILVDAGNGPDQAEYIKQALAEIEAPPVKYLIFTHHHWDHVFGAQEFEAPAIAGERCYQYLKTYSQETWNEENLKESIRKNPKYKKTHEDQMQVIENWDSFEIILPEIVFEEKLLLHFPDRELVLQQVGGQHSEDSIVVKDYQTGVMFLGDSFYAPPEYRNTSGSKINWSFLQELLEDEIELYAHSHGNSLSRRAVKRLLERHLD